MMNNLDQSFHDHRSMTWKRILWNRCDLNIQSCISVGGTVGWWNCLLILFFDVDVVYCSGLIYLKNNLSANQFGMVCHGMMAFW